MPGRSARGGSAATPAKAPRPGPRLRLEPKDPDLALSPVLEKFNHINDLRSGSENIAMQTSKSDIDDYSIYRA